MDTKHIFRTALIMFLTTLLTQCGNPSDDSSNDDGCVNVDVGGGKIQPISDSKSSICFSNEAVGQKHILVPFILGDLNTINGAADTEDNKTFQIDLTQNRSVQQAESENSSTALRSTLTEASQIHPANRAHNLRTLWNRFRSSKGLNQQKGFWHAVHAHDKWAPFQAQLNQGMPDSGMGPLETAFHQLIKKEKKQRKKVGNLLTSHTRLNTSACPDELYVIEADGYDDPINDNYITYHDQNSFCLALIKEEKLTSETDIDKIKNNIQETIGIFQLMYPQLATATATSYAWKPLVVVVPMDDAEVWPQGQAYQLQGAFVADVSELHERPTVFIPADITKVGADTSTANEAFHSAIGHEMHHAVLNFFRVWVNGGEDEFVSIDEGLAHYIEDVLGYGQLNFPLFPYLFLSTFAVAPDPILLNPSSGQLSASGRGAAQTFWYYLVSSKGGVQFKDGTIDTDLAASPGIEMLRSFVEGQASGTAALQSAHGGDWATTVGNFIGALVVDGTNTDSTTPFDAQDPVESVTDTSGGKNKIFGMKYNDFGGLADTKDKLNLYPAVKDNLASTKNIKFYQPSPFLYEVSDGENILEVSFGQNYDNAGVVSVRVE